MKHLLFFICSLTLLNAEILRVYLGTNGDGIYGTFLDTEKGTLSEAEKLVEIPQPVFLEKGKNGILYSTTNDKKKGGVAAFKIGENGGLSLLNQRETGAAGAFHVSLDQTGKVLLFVNYRGESSGSFLLEKDGSISEQRDLKMHEGSSVNKKRQKIPRPHSIYMGPENKFAYVPDLGTDEIWTYALNIETGALTLVDKAAHPKGGGPRHMKFGKNGKQAYVLSELTVDTVVYDRNPETGKLKQRSTVSNFTAGKDKTKMTCSEIRVSADGKFLYVANRDLDNKKRDSVSVFSVKENGDIHLIQEIPTKTWIPVNINLTPDGKWLLAVGLKTNEISLFSVDTETGKLTATNQQISVPAPMCIEF